MANVPPPVRRGKGEPPPQAAVLAIKEYARVAPSMDIRGAIDYARSLHAVINSSSEMRP